MIIRMLLILALLPGAAMTVLGGLAPFYPPAEYINHLRPYTLAGASLLLIAALAAGGRWITLASAVLVGLNAVLFALPVLWSAARADPAPPAQVLDGAQARDLKLVTFNTYYTDAAPIARLLIEQDADVVALQEVRRSEMEVLRSLLGQRFPYSHSCHTTARCAAAIFAKRPWQAAGWEPWSDDGPELIWVQFDEPQSGRFRFVGVHAAQPRIARLQVRHIDRLIALRRSLTGPVIIAGDFNLTPWSYGLQRLLAATGMRRHAIFLRSWPAIPIRRFRLPAPAFLIDNVITTPDVMTVSIRTGPNLGSDHLPVIAQLRLPPS